MGPARLVEILARTQVCDGCVTQHAALFATLKSSPSHLGLAEHRSGWRWWGVRVEERMRVYHKAITFLISMINIPLVEGRVQHGYRILVGLHSAAKIYAFFGFYFWLISRSAASKTFAIQWLIVTNVLLWWIWTCMPSFLLTIKLAVAIYWNIVKIMNVKMPTNLACI